MARRIGAMLVFSVLVSAGLFISVPVDGTSYVGKHVPGSAMVLLTDCNNVVRDNFVNGSLHLVMIGHTFQCTVVIDVHHNTVLGNLIVEVKNNKVFKGSMRVLVHDNNQTGGKLQVYVKDNEIHKRDPGKALPYNLVVKIDKNGKNAQDITKDEVVAMGLTGEITGNWVKNTLNVDSKQNFVGFDFDIEVNGNIVNNLLGNVQNNYACRISEIQFNTNTVDTKMKLHLDGNRATNDNYINVTNNQVPYLDPRLLEAYIKDNHAATGNTEVRVSGNKALTVKARIEWNGAGRNGNFEFQNNKPDGQNEIHILNNRVERVSNIIVMGNDPTPNPYHVRKNWACVGPNIPQLQPGATQAENVLRCTQQEPGDFDKDGLHDDYEKMIGT
ncbi:MAG: hypothetical protein JSV43_04915, partial [Methanobacteriota archaeon]